MILGCLFGIGKVEFSAPAERPAVFLPKQLVMEPNPAAPDARSVVVCGKPSTPNPFTTRVSVPAGTLVKPHFPSEDRVYNVISVVFCIGFGDTFGFNQLCAYPPSAFVFVPGASHFHAATSGEWVVQINSIGTTAFKYTRDADDPRR